MSDRYFGKVVSVEDSFTVVINAGLNKGVEEGDEFLIVGLGKTIKDPDTDEELGQLEIVRGKGEVSHLQPKMATLQSSEIEHSPTTREIKKITNQNPFAIFSGTSATSTELIKPGPEKPKEFKGVKIGDMVIRLPARS